MILKIFNTEIVDCSSSSNLLVPNPESLNLLLDIILKLCESEAVKAITEVSLRLNFYQKEPLEFISPAMKGHYYDVEFYDGGKMEYTLSHLKLIYYPTQKINVIYHFLDNALEEREIRDT